MKKNLYKLAKDTKSNEEQIEELNKDNFEKALHSQSAKSGIKK